MQRAREQFLQVNGVRLWTAVQGQGPPLVLCHGGPGGYDNLEPVAQMIDDLVTVCRYDQRGCGRSERKQPYNGECFVQDLESLRRTLGFKRWIVAGHSAGAELAINWAAAHPAHVSAVISICASCVLPTLKNQWSADYHKAFDARLSPSQLANRRCLEAELKHAAGPASDDIVFELSNIQSPTDLHKPETALAWPAYFPALLNIEVNRAVKFALPSHVLAKTTAPALVIHGQSDPRPQWGAKELVRHLPQAELVVLPNVGHYPWFESPDQLRRKLRDFLTESVFASLGQSTT